MHIELNVVTKYCDLLYKCRFPFSMHDAVAYIKRQAVDRNVLHRFSFFVSMTIPFVSNIN
jgi:hypothetical protein